MTKITLQLEREKSRNRHARQASDMPQIETWLADGLWMDRRFFAYDLYYEFSH